jgi:hypothetical protein
MSDPQPSPAVQALQKTPTINNQTPQRGGLSSSSSPHGSGQTLNLNMMDHNSVASSTPMSNIPQVPTASASTISALQQKPPHSRDPSSGMPSGSSGPAGSNSQPVAPVDEKKERERVTVLLEINNIFVQIAAKLQSEGKGCDLQLLAQQHTESRTAIPEENAIYFEYVTFSSFPFGQDKPRICADLLLVFCDVCRRIFLTSLTL